MKRNDDVLEFLVKESNPNVVSFCILNARGNVHSVMDWGPCVVYVSFVKYIVQTISGKENWKWASFLGS